MPMQTQCSQHEEMKMKITNKFNLPDTIVNVLKRPTYTKGKANISATELLSPPRIVQLKREHWDDIEEDASSMVWSLFGSAIHTVLEHGKDDHHLVEERLHAQVDGWKISGAIDLQEVEEDGIVISDYKTTGAWSVMNEKEDWHNQLNIYAWLVETVKGKPVKKLQIVAIIRDWAKRDTVKEGYPQAPIVVLDIPLWDYAKREEFIKSRVAEHSNAYFESETEGALPPCTPDDMWEKPTRWAIIKPGNVRAKSVHDKEEEAQHQLNQLKGYVIEVRPGERSRCENYCSVSKFCSQYKDYLESKLEK